MFQEAKSKYGNHDLKTKELEKLKAKISSLEKQIEATTERITELPKGIDASPFYDQLLKLQEHKTFFQHQLEKERSNQENTDEPMNFDDFQKFTDGLRQLTEKCTDPNIQSAIIRKLVSRIEVMPNSVIIHYHVGKTHYTHQLDGADTLGSSAKNFPLIAQSTDNDKTKGLVDLSFQNP